MKLYVFNPDSDLALANNEENYMPPAHIVQMAGDLALLPLWYAEPGNAVLAPSAYNAAYLKQLQSLFCHSVQLVTEPELIEYNKVQVMPWGWNPAFRKRLLKGGMAEESLPASDYLQQLRMLSSRHSALEVIRALGRVDGCCGEAFCLTSVSDCQEFVKRYSHSVLKMPWSGSGKGLNWCRGIFTDSLAGWCKRVINEQGCLLGEPVYNKVEDFALEFYSDGCGGVSFLGYSLFLTNAKGAYIGNKLLTDEEAEQWISRYLGPVLLLDIRARLQEELQRIYATAYTGYLGVDMMICRDNVDERYLLHPCVEINMRMNMGVVAHLLRERWVASGSRGRFVLTPYPSVEALQAAHREFSSAFPLVVEAGKIVSGYLPLVPVSPKSVFLAFIEITCK